MSLVTQEIPTVATDLILPSPENPRRRMDGAKFDELVASVRAKGILHPLLLRPRGPFRIRGVRASSSPSGGWEVFSHDGTVLYARDDLGEIEAKRVADLMMKRHFEIVAGERRWRAACKAGLVEVPAIVRNMSDDDALELRWIENLQREDIDPIDEAHGLARMLALKGDTGKPRYTIQTLSVRLHKPENFIHERLPLVNLPVDVAQAVRSGELSFKVGTLIGRVPAAPMRAEIAQKVLHPALQESPLDQRQTAKLIRENYCRELRAAPFNREDPDLVENAVPCPACPYNSANQPGNREFGRLHMCTNLECFRAKTEAAWQKLAAKAASEGKQVLSIAESEAIFPPAEEPGIMAAGSSWVELSWKPEPELLKREIENPPAWSDLIGDVKVPLIVARDQGGRVVELADRRLCMEAAAVHDETTGGNESAIFRESEKKVRKVRVPPPPNTVTVQQTEPADSSDPSVDVGPDLATKAGQSSGLSVTVGSDFVRERRYIVIKLSDARQHLSDAEKSTLEAIARKVATCRTIMRKPPLECVVIESDWPEYEPAWRAIERRMTQRVGTESLKT